MTDWRAKLEAKGFTEDTEKDRCIPIDDALAVLNEAVAAMRAETLQTASTLVLSRQILPGIKLNDTRADRHDDTLRSLARHLTQMAKGAP